MVRIGRHAIGSFPNFGHWRVRLHLLFHGSMPVTKALPEPWHETPKIHLCTVKDFIALTTDCCIEIKDVLVMNDRQHLASLNNPHLATLFGQQALLRLKRD